MSTSGISRLLRTWCWPNFNGRFLEPSLTDVNCWGDICPVNIFPCDICPYQEYLSCYKFLDPKFFLNFNFFEPWFLDQYFLGVIFFYPTFSLDPTLLGLTFFGHGLFFDQKDFGTNFFHSNNNNHNQNFNGFWHN